jgi:2'-hydroxyisoflavone reductase
MKLTRRELLKTTGTLGAGLSLAGVGAMNAFASPDPKSILILGGTGFIGPHTVRYAVERGHKVSIFTRGKKQVDLPATVERLVGDRNDDHTALEGRKWDVVIDNNCRDYRWAQKSTELLKDATGQYLFVSSISAYLLPQPGPGQASKVFNGPPLAVNSPLVGKPAGWKDGDEAGYAWMKVNSENIVQAAFPGRSTIVRPTLIVGPGDPTWRWSYWPLRLQAGGEILAPGNPQHSVQIIDQRDLAEWHIRLVENGHTGIFNGAGPAERLSFESMLQQTGSVSTNDWSLTWVAEDFLNQHGVMPWSDMPAWVPGDPMMYVDISASLATGLSFRPLPLTAKDTLAFEQSRPPGDTGSRGFSMTPERERQVLDAWKASE